MADNTTKSLLTYETRKYYKYSFFNDVENTIDFWSKQRYYGILDTKCVPVYLNQKYLKSIGSQGISNTGKKQSLLNVASDCFKEMVTEFKNADTAFIISKSIYNPLNVKKSTLTFEEEYTTYFRNFLNVLYEEKKNEIDNQIDNFDSFLKFFISSISLLSKPILSQTAYLTSFLCSPSVSGLSVEISNEKHDKDPKKISGYIQNENFPFVYNTAAKYSFMIDKNAPWRFVFNISSDYALGKLQNYNIESVDQMFSKFYTYPHLIEYTSLRDELIKFYNLRISKKSTLQKSSYCHSTKGLKFETVVKDTNTDKDNLFWIQMCYFIRCREEQTGMTQSQFDSDLKKIRMLYNSAGEEATLNWILNKTKKFLDGGTNPTYTQYKSIVEKKKNNSTPYTFSI